MKQENLNKVIELRHALHRHPELSGQESETKKRLMAFLQENTNLTITDCGQWFYAEYHPEKPADELAPMAFRADFDAIKVLEETPLPYCSVNPGVAHKLSLIHIYCTIQLCVDTFEESEIVFLENPFFVDKVKGKVYPMVIVSVQPGETLWTLAKRYRTTEEHIRIANQLEGEAEPGRRLLIVK